MNSSLHTRVLGTIEKHSMMQPGDRIGVGVSGGADSVALLRLLVELRSRLGIWLAVCHFHHQLRGSEADADQVFVAGVAERLGLDFISDRGDVAGEARRHGWNLEDAARRMRYAFFEAAVAEHGLTRVAVAHTSDDQAETVLSRLLRGTGPAGLASIYPVARRIVRPLLELRRREIRDYLGRIGQSWREDSTNQDTNRMRARIRHRLMPLLEQDFEAAIVPRLARLAGLAREEESFLRALEEERFSALMDPSPAGGISVRVANLMIALAGVKDPLAGLALARRLLRRVYFELRGTQRQLTARHVEAALRLASSGQSGSRIEWPGVRVQRTFGKLIFSNVSAANQKAERRGESEPELAFEYPIGLSRDSHGATIVIPEIRRRLNLKVVDWPPASGDTRAGVDALDFERLRQPLALRNWRPGDSYRPHHRRGVRKLKRMLLEKRIPVFDRARWPVLTSDGSPAWSLGCPVADQFAPRPETRLGLVILEEAL